jgi:exopolyphosphatase/guanosine-5'-triphosphate,3'-diphosphate pyrophosphatase
MSPTVGETKPEVDPESLAESARQKPVAVIDIGSSSIQITIASVGSEGIETLERAKNSARLRMALDRHGHLAKVVMKRVTGILSEYRKLADAHQAPIRATATATLRAAVNAQEFVDLVRIETGIEIEIISGFDEARLVYRGARHGLPQFDGQEFLCIDAGGGSTEWALGREASPQILATVPIGTLVVHRRWLGFGHIGPGQERRASRRLHRLLKPLCTSMARRFDGRPVCTGGSAQRIARVARELSGEPDASIHSYSLTRESINAVIDHIVSARSPAARSEVPGMDPERADQLLGGALIYQAIGQLLQIDEWTVSMSAIRAGMILDFSKSD